jgi:hypothetical protein
VVAVATAWSGYQSARWDGRSSLLYGHSSTYRAQSVQLSTQAGQQKLYDVVTFNTWAQAIVAGNTELANFYVRRFSPEYRVAFDAWLKTDPIHHPQTAPEGPAYMPQYHNKLQTQSDALGAKASAAFDEGTAARETGDQYVRATVLLATVLFLVAMSQRFEMRAARIALLGVGLVLLVWGISDIVQYPIA